MGVVTMAVVVTAALIVSNPVLFCAGMADINTSL